MIRLHFVDGQRGDDDLIANAMVVEPGAPGVFAPVANPGFSYVDANRDGRFFAADGDIPLIAGELSDGFLDTRRREGPNYRQALKGAGLVIAEPSGQLFGRKLHYYADGPIVVYSNMTAIGYPGRIQLLSRAGDVAILDATLIAKQIKITASTDLHAADTQMIASRELMLKTGGSIELLRAEVYGGQKVHLEARHGDLMLDSATLTSTGSSKGTLKLQAGKTIHASQAELWATAVIRVRAKDRVFAEWAQVLACSGKCKVDIRSEGDIVLSGAVLRARDRIQMEACRRAVDLVMADLAITGGAKGDICIKGAMIGVQDASLLAPDRICLSVTPTGIPTILGKGTKDCP